MTKLHYIITFASLPSTSAFVEPENTFGTSLVSATNATQHADGTVFYAGDEIPPEYVSNSSNLFHDPLDLTGATYDARSGKVANLDLSDPILPGEGNDLSWSVGIGDSPYNGQPQNDDEWSAVGVDALQGWINSHQLELNVDASELFVVDGDDDDMSVRTGVHNDGDMIQFSLQRKFKGVIVRGSRVSATIKVGNLVNVGFELWSDIPSDFDVFPRINANQAYEVLSRTTGYDLDEGETCVPELQILTQTSGEAPMPDKSETKLRSKASRSNTEFGKGYTLSLVWVVCPIFQGQTEEMFEALVDAKTSTIYSIRDTVEYFEAKGDIYPLSNDGEGAEGQLQFDWPMPFANVGREVTDTGGNYFNQGTWAAYLTGPYFNMIDICGRDVLTGNGGIDWGGQGAKGDCDTPGFGGPGNTHSSRSGFYELNKIGEMARSHLPSNSWLRKRLNTIMNVNRSCNAYFNGNIYFYRYGGGCRNTGEIASIVDHEWGHGMDNAGVAAGISKPSGEGIADIYSALRLNDSCIGRGFWEAKTCGGKNPCLTCTGVRDIDYTKHRDKTPSTYSWANKNCGGSVHCLGYVYSEAVWSLYKRYLPSAPYNMDENTALEVVTRLTFIAAGNVQTWFDGRPPYGGCGTSSGYRQYLLADDDNGNLSDGTPHMTAIFHAFNDQEIACWTPTVRDSGCPGTPNVAPLVSVTPGNMKATLNWNAVPGASRYEVFRTEGVHKCEQGKVKLATLSASQRTHTDDGLQNGREYYYVVIPKGPNPSCFGRASECIDVKPSQSATSPPSARPTPSNPGPTPPGPTPTSTPCGNGVCELQKNEDPTSCSRDCIARDLELASGTGRTKAAMFTATAINSLAFSSIGIYGKKTRNSLVQIYTRVGSYVGFEESSSGWTLCSNEILLLNRDAPTYVDLSCQTYTPAGSSRSFHVYVKAGMLLQEAAPAPSNMSLKTDTGIFFKNLFKEVKGNGLMAGFLRFYEVGTSNGATPRPTPKPSPKPTANSDSGSICGDGRCTLPKEDPKTCPNDCVVQGLQLTATIDNVARAVMFRVTALQKMAFASFTFTAANTRTTLVEIYTLVGDYSGNEKNPSAWQLCFSNNMELTRGETVTIDALTCPTTTGANVMRSFQVFAKNGLYLQDGLSAASNSLLKVENSIFMRKKFDKKKGDGLMTGGLKFFRVSD